MTQGRDGQARPMQLSWILWNTERELDNSLEAALSRHGITLLQLHTLLLISEQQSLSGTELARFTKTTPQAANLALTALQKKGLVTREQDPRGGRALRTVLTDDGHTVAQAGLDIVHDFDARIQAGLSASERQTLITLLNKLAVPPQ